MGQLGTDAKALDWASQAGGWINVREETLEGSALSFYRANFEHVQSRGLCHIAAYGLKPETARGALWDLLVMLKFAD